MEVILVCMYYRIVDVVNVVENKNVEKIDREGVVRRGGCCILKSLTLRDDLGV